MKNLKIYSLLICALFLLPNLIQSQEDSKPQAYRIHEDRVKPSMVDKYEKLAVDLIANLKKHQITESSWITSVTENYKYLYVSPIDNMADLDKPLFSNLGEKMGEEALNNIFNEMNTCYDSHGNYILYLDKKLTYMPNGITQTPEGQNYRAYSYYYVTAENQANFWKAALAIKEYFIKINSKYYYRIYRGGFGIMDNYFLVVFSAKDAADYEKLSRENITLMGDGFKPLRTELLKYTEKYEKVRGQIRPDLGYSSN